jgi:hypothetical protein
LEGLLSEEERAGMLKFAGSISDDAFWTKDWSMVVVEGAQCRLEGGGQLKRWPRARAI